jgi:Fe-S-cluster-containing hydrogenase component 2
MIANYGFKNGSGDYFISIDTDQCNGCGDCVLICPANIFEIREIPVAALKDSERNKIKYACGPCKPVSDRLPLPCLEACKTEAIAHSGD